jgi:hypothetical protein
MEKDKKQEHGFSFGGGQKAGLLVVAEEDYLVVKKTEDYLAAEGAGIPGNRNEVEGRKRILAVYPL